MYISISMTNKDSVLIKEMLDKSKQWEIDNHHKEPKFGLTVVNVVWKHKPGNADDLLYSALHVSQPTYDSAKHGVLLKDSWCSSSIFTAAEFLNGSKRLANVGTLGNIAVLRGETYAAERPHMPFKHLRVTKDTGILGMLTVRVSSLR